VKIQACRRWSWKLVWLSTALLVGASPVLRAQQDSSEPPAANGELKTVAVIAGAKWDKLISDITFLGSLAGKPEAGQMVEGGFSFFTQGKGPNAIDKSQPWGVIVQTDGAQFLAVGCLPLLKPGDLLDIAKGYGAEVKDAENGAKELVLPNKRSLFFKHENNMGYLGATAASLARLPQNPQQVLMELVGDYDLAASVAFRNVPETYRQFALQAMQAGVQQGLKKKDDESDEQFAARQKMAEAQMEQMKRLINEVQELKFGLAVDAKAQKTFADFQYTFVPDSSLAKQMAGYVPGKTDFAGFFQSDSAGSVLVSSQSDKPLSGDELAQTEQMMQSARDQINAAIDQKIEDTDVRDALKGALGDWLDAVAETAKSGKMDGGGALHLTGDSLTLISGVHVKDTEKVEAGLKKLEAAAKKQPDFPGIKWNAAEHAGVKFHTIAIPVPEGEKSARQMLGDQLDVAVGVGNESAYLAVGKDNLDAVNKAIDASASSKGKTVTMLEFVSSLGPIMEAAAAQAEDPKHKAVVQKVADYLRAEGKGRDHVKAVGKVIPNGLAYHFEAEEGVLKAIGTAASEVQKQKMEAQQQQ
jgi:hypothetical protein